MREERSLLRKKTALVGLVLVLLIGGSLCITDSDPLIVSPLEVLSCYGLWFQQLFVSFTNPVDLLTAAELRAVHPLYMQIIAHAGFTLIYVIAGFLLALAGALYQNVFRNAIASPAMLGVSSGIQLGVAVLVMVYGTAAGYFLVQRYVFAYIAVIVTLVALFGFARLMTTKGQPVNVVNMLLVGTIINQFVGVFVTYITWYVFDEESYDIFSTLTTMVVPSNAVASWVALIGGAVVSILPIVLLRFRLNLLSFGADDMKMLGVNASRLQLIALVCGSIMMITAQLQVGAVAMITLVVPHISRALFGAEFSKQLVGNLLLGAVLLLACHIIASLVPYSGEVPIGVVVNFVVLPAFVWMIATQQRKWE